MTFYTPCKSLSLKVFPVICYLRMTSQAIVKTQDRFGMGFVTSSAFEFHRSFSWKCLALELNPCVTVKAYLSFWLESRNFGGEKLMTGRTVKTAHPSNVDTGLIVTFDTVLSLWLGGMEGWEVARKTIKFGTHHVDIMPSSVSDLRPLCRLV